MPELQALNLDAVRAACPANYSSGLKYFKDGAVQDPWRTPSALHARVAGSAKDPYEVSVWPRDDGSYGARCTCPAARRQGVCKHAVTLLVAWAEAPARFPLREEPVAPPAAKAGGLKMESEAKRLRAPKVDKRGLIAAGLDKAEELLVELCARGLLAVTPEQVATIGALGASLGAHKLRRLSRQVAQIQSLAATARGEGERFDEGAWARLLGDTWFTLAATRKALEKGDAAEPGELEELVGKTWLEKDLRRLRDLRLLELAYETDRRAAGFRIDTSYLLDLGEGALYTEKQITPLQLKDVPRKPCYALPLRVAEAGVYPGYAPYRLKLLTSAAEATEGDAWERALALAEDSAAALRTRLSQATASLVAPQEVYSLFRPAHYHAAGAALYLVDGEDKAVAVWGETPGAAYALRAALTGGPVAGVFCRVRFGETGLVAEPLSALRPAGVAGEPLVRLTA